MKLTQLRIVLNNSQLQQQNPALYQVINGILENEFADPYNPTWQDYTPTFIATGTLPSLGTDGLAIGRFITIFGTTFFNARFVLGTGFSFGTGNLGATLPKNAQFANFSIPNPMSRSGFTAVAVDVGTGSYQLLSTFSVMNGLHSANFLQWANPLATITTTAPFTFVAGDVLEVSGWYQSVE